MPETWRLSYYFKNYMTYMEQYPTLYTLSGLAFLTLVACVGNFIVKRLLLRFLNTILGFVGIGRDQEIKKYGVIDRLANIVPAILVIRGLPLVPHLADWMIAVIRNVAAASIILSIALALSATLNVMNTLYTRKPKNANKSIKGYLQILKLAIFLVSFILIIATLVDKSPLILLSGVGAMAAVLMLVFQDTLLSLVASIQISSSDMVRVGDWIEMPQLNADGDVIDIALHTVKVQNWDKTITTLPTRRLISDPFKNWRGMQESGGRRIKRSIYLDQSSIRFLEADELKRLKRFSLLGDYLEKKEDEITQWNRTLEERQSDPVNARKMTNIGTFRAYVIEYLKHHPGIHQNMTMLVRQLSPGAEGLPLEIYCFTNNTAWAVYEGIQSDIFDHLYAILPEFGLYAFQNPSGGDFRSLARPAA